MFSARKVIGRKSQKTPQNKAKASTARLESVVGVLWVNIASIFFGPLFSIFLCLCAQVENGKSFPSGCPFLLFDELADNPRAILAIWQWLSCLSYRGCPGLVLAAACTAQKGRYGIATLIRLQLGVVFYASHKLFGL